MMQERPVKVLQVSAKIWKVPRIVEAVVRKGSGIRKKGGDAM